MSVKIENYSLKALRQKLREARNAEIEKATITLTFSSPKSFVHEWTLEDISTVEQLNEEVDETEERAKERLRDDWFGTDSSNRQYQEIAETFDIEKPEEISNFLDLKEAESDLESTVNLTRNTYDRVNRSRSQIIQNRFENSPSLESYRMGLMQVNETLDFEENTNIDESGSAFEEGRQRTSGDVTWYNRTGEPVRTLIYPNRVIYQVGGPQGEQIEFNNKEEAEQFFKENRIA